MPLVHAVKILIDLDGPLLDVSSRHHCVYAEIVREGGGRPLSRQAYWRLKRARTPLPEVLRRSRCRMPASRYEERWLSLIERPRHLESDRLVPGAAGALNGLAGKVELHLVTLRRDRRALLGQLARFGVDRQCASVVSGPNRSGRWDAKRDLIIKAGLLRGGSPALIVGDTEGDILSGKCLGIPTCAVLNGVRNRRLIAAMEPEYTVRDIRGVPRIIRRLLHESHTRP